MKDYRTLAQIIFDFKIQYARIYGEKFILTSLSEIALLEAARKIKQGRHGEWIEKNGIRQIKIY